MRLSLPADRRSAQGRRNHRAGLWAEHTVERLYREAGAEILDRRLRIGGGELDLIALEGDVLVFVEVKKRRRLGADSPVSAAQWRRLEQAASQFMLDHTEKTGRACRARFDVVLMDDAARPTVIRNARGFEQQY